MLGTIATVAGALATIYCAYLAHIGLSPRSRIRFAVHRKIILRIMGRLFFLGLVAGVAALSLAAIVLFAISDKPIARLEVVILHLHFINLVFYGCLTVQAATKFFNKKPLSRTGDGHPVKHFTE